MLAIFLITCCVLMTRAGLISGYSRATPSGGRGQEYSGGYRTDTLVGTKDSQGDFSDNTGYNRYPVITGGTGHSSTTGSSYVTDSGYSDPETINGQSGAYGGQTNTASSSSSYPDVQAGSSELGGSNYSPSIVASGGLVGYKDFADGTMGGAGGKFSAGSIWSNERGEYSSSRPVSSYGPYTLGGPKSSVYASSANHQGGQGHASKSYSPSQGYSIGGHRGISSSFSYSPEPSRAVVASGSSNYASGPPSKSFLANTHGSGNYVQHGGFLHRTTPSHHLFASASNLSPSYNTRGPPSGGFFTSGNPYHRGNGNPGGKIILVKETANNAHNPGHIYPNEHHGYTGGTFGPSNSLYKTKNVPSQTSHGPSNYPSVYSTSGNYNGASSPSSSSSLHSGHNNGGSIYSFL